MGIIRLSWMERGNVKQVYVLGILMIILSVNSLSSASVEREEDLDKKYVVSILTHLASYLKNRFSSMSLSEKRGIDFGLGRGYSGSQAARHMLGLQQVNQAGGPGKKKRSGGQVWTLHLHSQE